MSKIFISVNNMLGKWVIQRTIYNLLSDTVTNIQNEKHFQQNIPNITSKSLFFSKEFDLKILCASINSKENKTKSYVKTYVNLKLNIGSKIINLNKIFLFNDLSQIYVSQKCCCLDSKNTLIIQYQDIHLSALEKSWLINQNLMLNISIIKYNTNIISVIFESRIRR